ncbi:hypothetical protein JB92DRAFT_2919969 [Gautieria morchelliformis]|nr:hypothetical protein JB92DRAFT_2919969 [Gautieria morchelliformis]
MLKSVQRPTHLSELARKPIAVDAYVWLHRGAYACPAKLVTGVPTTNSNWILRQNSKRRLRS